MWGILIGAAVMLLGIMVGFSLGKITADDAKEF